MINFRFHLVSLIAVFLALGLGILVGSSVVDRVIVNRLDAEIKSVQHESDQRSAENNKLHDQLSQVNDFLHKSAAFAVDQRLSGIPVALVVDKGVDSGQAKAMLDILHAAGAQVPGVLWLNDRWRLDSPKDLDALHKAAHVSGNAAAARIAALREVALRLAEPPVTGRRAVVDVLPPLRDGGFIDLTRASAATLAQFPTRAARVLLVTGTNSHLSASDTMIDLVNALVDAKVPTVVAEVYDDHGGTAPVPVRGASLAPVRGDPQLAKQVSSLDDGELPQGDVTAVIALEQIVDGTIGHYGYGQGATATLPQHPS